MVGALSRIVHKGLRTRYSRIVVRVLPDEGAKPMAGARVSL